MSSGIDFLPFSKLSNKAVPPRIRGVLEGCYQVVWTVFESSLGKLLEDFENTLFRDADRATSNDQQTRILNAMREIRRRRGDIVHAARQRAHISMLSLLDPQLRAEFAKDAKPGALSLVDNSVLEEQLAIDELVAKNEIRHTQVLHVLAVRFALIGGGAPLLPEHDPIGPARVIDWLACSFAELEVPTKVKTNLLTAFERSFMLEQYASLLEVVNQFLVEQKILPNLSLTSRSQSRAVSSAAERKSEAPPEAPEATAEPESSATAAPPTAPTPPRPAIYPPIGPLSMPPQLSIVPRVPEGPSLPPSPAAPAPTEARRPSDLQGLGQPHDASTATAIADSELFNTLRELLAGRRSLSGEQKTPSAAAIASTNDIQGILSVLQAQPVAPIMVGGKWVSRRVGHIKQDVQAQLRALAPAGSAPLQIAPEDSDTMDLVGFLFEHLTQDLQPSSASHGLLTKLQAPLLKVALHDKSFFTRRNHPARQLLNSLAETAHFWVDDDDGDSQLTQKMQLVVDRVVSEYDGDVQVFENLVGELGKHLQTVQKKAEVAEKRHVEAARGREKLELAREHAIASVQQRTADRELPALLTELLNGAWCDVLALTMLREGEESQLFMDRLQLMDVLIECFGGIAADDAQHNFDAVSGAIEIGLQAIGFHGEEIDKTLDGLEALLPESLAAPMSEPDAPARTTPEEVKTILQSKTRFGQEVSPTPRGTILSALRKTEEEALTDKEKSMLTKIKQMPFGTWFDFVLNQQGQTARRKLSWFSPVTGRCLFVNARGAKAEERTLTQLARDLVRGNVTVYQEPDETMIDRAWRSIVTKLKKWTGSDQTLAETMASGQEAGA